MVSEEILAKTLIDWLIEYLPIAVVIVKTMKDMESGKVVSLR